jgi:Cu+-exporting ATPase
VRVVRVRESWPERTQQGKAWQTVAKEQTWIWVVAGDLDTYDGAAIRDFGLAFNGETQTIKTRDGCLEKIGFLPPPLNPNALAKPLAARGVACAGGRIGYDGDHLAPGPEPTHSRPVLAGCRGRLSRGVSYPVAIGSVSTVIDNSLAEVPGHGLKGLVPEAPGPTRAASARASGPARPGTAPCFHCGEPCYDPSLAKDDKAFCCRGCLFVHDLLAESGLGQFYDLNRHPGVRIRQQARREQWAYLDEPALQQRLLDFTDGKVSRVTFQVPAIHCVACVWLLENLFRLHPGVGRSQVNFPRREVMILFATEKLPLSELVGLLASIGYEPVLTLGELEKRKVDPARKRQWLQVGIAGFAFGNIMLLSLPTYMGLDSLSGPLFKVLSGYLSLALAAPVLLYSASDYWRSARLSLRQRVVTLDVPIALGLAALYAQSAYEVVLGRGNGYLDSLAALVFFLLCGRVFQQKTHDRLAFDRDYKCFFPLSVTRVTADGEESVGISNLRVGDKLRLRNGELIPADGRLLGGPASIDYSFVTGEAEAVAKAPGDYLYAGGRQTGGAIEIETVKAVSQSHLTSLWNHEAFRKERESSLNTLTNRYSRRFTLIVIAVAVGSAVFWAATGDVVRGLKAFTSVLIVACPCALALAAPFTLGTAQRLLARMQVFLKNALVLERMAQVNAIVFDKTGTLTAGAGERVAFHAKSEGRGPKADGDRSFLDPTAARAGLSVTEEAWVGSVARHSTHPLAVRIAQWQAGKAPAEPVEGFAETPGCGIQGRVQGHEVRLGSRAWLEEHGVSMGGPAACAMETARLSPTAAPVPAPPLAERARERRPSDSTIVPEPLAPQSGETGSPGATAMHPLAPTLPVNLSETDGHLPPSRSPSEGERVPSGRLRGLGGSKRERPVWGGLSSSGGEGEPPEGSVVCLAIDGTLRGEFVLANAVRPETDQLLRRLGEHHELALLSGDNEKEQARFRSLFGSRAALHFNQSPLDKLGFIRGLQESGQTVMMVGDGLNDAGALKQADVGVAVVEKAGAFSPASDVILEAGRVPRLSQVLSLARKSTQIVRLSFGISAAYNLAGISIAAAGILSPVICAILMPVSSISVVLFACGATNLAAKRAGLTK